VAGRVSFENLTVTTYCPDTPAGSTVIVSNGDLVIDSSLNQIVT
jgi:hypothetical protein